MANGLLIRLRKWLQLDYHQGIIDHYPMPIFAVDDKYCYLYFNEAHATVMKALYNADIKKRHSLFEYQTVLEDAEKAKTNLDRTLAGETVVDHAFSGEANRVQAYFEVIHYPLRDSLQQIYGAAVHVKDVTAQRKAEEEAKILQEQLITAQRIGKVGSWEYHIQDDTIWGSEEGSRIYGLEHVEGDYPIDLIESCIPDRDMVHQALLDLIAEEKPYNLEFPIQPFGSDEQKIITSVAELIRDDAGRPLKVVGVIQDVTEQRKVEKAKQETEARFRQAVMAAPFPTIIHADDGDVILVNTAWSDMSGYPAEAFSTIDAWAALVRGGKKDIVKRGIDRFFDGDQKVAEGEFTFIAKNGEIRIWDFYSTPLGRLSDGRRIVLRMANDVTARKQAEKLLAEANGELEQRVHERTHELESANEELAAFVYSVSHDLRAPLRAVDGYSYLILNDEKSQLSEKSEDYLNRIRDNAHTLSRIIDDLLSLSRTERERLVEVEVDLDRLARQVVAEIQPEVEGHTIYVNYHDLPVCRGDAGLLKLVLVNLLSNAFKFTRRREPAVIEIGSEKSEDYWTIFIKDNGVGFNMAYADRLFGVFERLHRANEYEGTGIGLAIVKNIIEKHGGKVWVEAEENKGAAFFFTLKIAETEHGESDA